MFSGHIKPKKGSLGNRKYTAIPDVMRYKNPTPNPLSASDKGA
jgi:hypothetical protein